ncbi:MAG: S8 family serine peptidase [Chloroflexota bacterium]
MKKLISIAAGLLAVLVLLLAAIPPGQPAMAADPQPGSKISSFLDLRIKAKMAKAAQPAALRRAAAPANVDRNVVSDNENLTHEQVFIYFAQRPTARQVSELAAIGVTVYPESWMPPVGKHPTGFVLADAPVDRIGDLAARADIARIDSAEQLSFPQNDYGRTAMNVGDVWTGGWTGTGVTVAVLDSGLDTSHADFPTPVYAKDYSAYPILDDTIGNTVTGHGTHVAGSVLGRGTLNSNYKGSAPGASLAFYKIGNDTTGSATSDAEIYAMKDAVDNRGAKIITMSYGGWSTYHDGSSSNCQGVDYAVSQGATVFISAGNNGAYGWHDSGTAPSNSWGNYHQFTITSGSSYSWMGLVWYDGLGTNRNLRLHYYNSSYQEITAGLVQGSQSESPRGTEAIDTSFASGSALPAGTYYVRVQNLSDTGQGYHIYYYGGSTSFSFNEPDAYYTLGAPAEADSAIAVGAYVTRGSWTNYLGTTYTATLNPNPGVIATFSSRGPRVDAYDPNNASPPKPNVVAPGAQIISARDSLYTPGTTTYDYYIISNGTSGQPANYYVMQGTSMACPLAAGVGALILNKNPTWTQAQVRHALEKSAVDKGASGWDGNYGWGLVDASSAINTLPVLGSYSDAARTTASNAFSGSATAYLRGTGFLPNHSYRAAWYSGSGAKINTESLTSTSGGVLDTQRTFVPASDAQGNWYAVVCEPQFTPPDTYSATWPYTIMSDTFSYGTAPTVTTGSATGVSTTGATLNGNLTSLGSATTVNVSFEYGTTTGYGTTTTPQAKTATGAFTQALTGLTAGATYHFRAKAESTYGTATGNDATFSTITAPSVTTLPASGTTTNSTTLNGNLTALGTATSVNASFEYGTTTAYGNTTPDQAKTATGSFNAAVTGLNASTLYHYRARGDGGAHGMGLGADTTFTTFAASQLVAETGLTQSIDTDLIAVVNVNINRIKDISTGSTATIPGGVGGYSATASSSQLSSGSLGAVVGMELIAVRGVAPYDNPAPTINTTTGVFGTTGITAPAQPDNSTAARLALKLTGDNATTYIFNNAFSQITAATGGSNVPEQNSNSLTFKRGDTNGNGAVDVFDAMFIAQYIVGVRPLSQINILNAACVKHDGTGGDKLDVFDAMYIAQYVVGLRNNRFETS